MKERKAIPRKPRTTRDLATFSAGAVDTYQTVNRYTTRARPDVELVARAISGSYYAACNLLATVMASQTMRLYRPTTATSKVFAGVPVRGRKRLDWLTGQGKHRPGLKGLALAGAAGDCEEVLDHPALWTLYRPMDGMTFAQWVWQLYFWMEGPARAFVWMGTTNPPALLFPMAPQFVNVIGSKTAGIAGYRYGRATTGAFDIDPSEMLYLRERIHPSDPLGAIGWAHSVTMPSDMENAAFQAEIRRWENGGMPGMIIEATGTPTDSQKLQVEQSFERQYRGVNKAGKTLFLWNGKPSQVGVKPHEMAYKEGITLAAEYIFRAAGIPDTVWKMAEANKASAVMGDPQFMAMRILPSINSLAEKLTEEYLPRFEGTDGWWFAYDNPVAEDEKALQDKVKVLTDSGLATGNEGRAMLSMEPAGPELDVLRWQGVPLKVKDAPPPDPMTPGADPADPEDDPKEPDEPKPEPEKEPEAKAIKVDAHSLTCACGKPHTTVKSVADAEGEFARALHQWYDRAVRSSITPDGAMVRDFDQAELQRIIDTGLRNVFNESALASISESGADIGQTLVDSAAANYARERAAELVTNVTETLRQQVRDNIVQGIEQGRTINEIRDELASSGIADTRTETIVRTETSMAVQGAARRTYAEAGWEGKYWDNAGGPCPLCEAIVMRYGASNPIPIDQPYFRAGESIIGTDGKVYTFSMDVMDAVAHPNDRCTSIYVEVIPQEATE